MLNLVYPAYFRIFCRKTHGWTVQPVSIFYNPKNRNIDPDDLSIYETTPTKVVVELFRQYGGKLGYYLADLRHKKYYYCGLTDEDIQQTLYSLGIGRQENA